MSVRLFLRARPRRMLTRYRKDLQGRGLQLNNARSRLHKPCNKLHISSVNLHIRGSSNAYGSENLQMDATELHFQTLGITKNGQ